MFRFSSQFWKDLTGTSYIDSCSKYNSTADKQKQLHTAVYR